MAEEITPALRPAPGIYPDDHPARCSSARTLLYALLEAERRAALEGQERLPLLGVAALGCEVSLYRCADGTLALSIEGLS